MPRQVCDIKLKRDELARNLGGGIPTSSIFVIEGRDGGGKSIIAQRIAFGLLENDQTVTYISTELSLMGFIQQMDSLGYRITDKVLSEKLLFISMFPQIGKVRLKDAFLDDLVKSHKLFSSQVIVIDTISFLLLSEKVDREKVFMLISFIKRIIALGKTIVACIDPDQCNIQFMNLIRNIADIYIQTEAKTVLGTPLHIFTIIRYKKSPSEVIPATPFKVIPGSGFAIELASLA